MSELPAELGLLKLVNHKVLAFINRADNRESVRVFSIWRRALLIKALRGIRVLIEDFGEASAQFSTVLNIRRALRD